MSKARNIADLLEADGEVKASKVDAHSLPLAGGTMTGDTLHGDSVKAKFGTGGGDLQIFHDGSNSFINEVGTGDLTIKASNNLRILSATSENMAVFTADGAATLFHNNSAKISTTSIGVDISGSVTSDGLTVEGEATFQKNSLSRIASFGSLGVTATSIATPLGNSVSIGRTLITVPPNTTTSLVNGYGGSVVIIAIRKAVGGDDIQKTFLVTHAWSSASVLFSQNYGGNNSTVTFSASSGALRVNHNHSGDVLFTISALMTSGPVAT